jgi:carboxyl-terminal processing protease
MNDFFKSKYFPVLVISAILFFSLGAFAGFHMDSHSLAASPGSLSPENSVDMSDFWKVWNTIDEKYPDASKVTEQDRVYGAISGLLGSLNDPYSIFFKPEEAKSFQEDISGTFIGIGMEVGIKDKVLTVIAPLKDTPAYKAGIKPGDRVIKIDDKSTNGLTVEEAVKLIRGERGTSVTLRVLHEGDDEPTDIKIVRDVINIPTLETELRSDKVFVIRLFTFTANSPTLFRNALREFSDAKTDKLILDLRGNPGGYLDAAVSISSWFLPTGDVVVTEDKGNNSKPTIFRSKGYDIFGNNLKLVVLMDKGSASASEIVAGALRDNKKALLVGDTSFGKGSVQEVVPLTGDTILKITVAKWLTPSGLSISLKGLEPDYKVELTKDDITNHHDTQVEKAASLLNNWPGIK